MRRIALPASLGLGWRPACGFFIHRFSPPRFLFRSQRGGNYPAPLWLDASRPGLSSRARRHGQAPRFRMERASFGLFEHFLAAGLFYVHTRMIMLPMPAK